MHRHNSVVLPCQKPVRFIAGRRVRLRVLHFVFALLCLAKVTPLEAQTLNTTDFQIEWKVTNRFRLFNDADFFKLHENAWRQYLIHVNEQQIPEEQKSLLTNGASVLGSERRLLGTWCFQRCTL